MKYALSVAMIALALALGGSSAVAFTTITNDDNLDNKAGLRLADPDDITNNMANQSTSGNSHSVTIMKFGNGSLQFQAGASSANSEVGVESNFIQSPGANLVPSQHR